MNTPSIVPVMLVMAAKISVFHVFRNIRCAISSAVSMINAIAANIIPMMRCSFGGMMICLAFLFLPWLGRVIFLAKILRNSFFKVYPSVFFFQAGHDGFDGFFEGFGIG